MRGNTLSGRRKMFGWTAVAFIAAVIILCGTIHIFASSGDSRPYNKYYTSVRVEEGDTVWSIADRYIADSQVGRGRHDIEHDGDAGVARKQILDAHLGRADHRHAGDLVGRGDDDVAHGVDRDRADRRDRGRAVGLPGVVRIRRGNDLPAGGRQEAEQVGRGQRVTLEDMPARHVHGDTQSGSRRGQRHRQTEAAACLRDVEVARAGRIVAERGETADDGFRFLILGNHRLYGGGRGGDRRNGRDIDLLHGKLLRIEVIGDG